MPRDGLDAFQRGATDGRPRLVLSDRPDQDAMQATGRWIASPDAVSLEAFR